MANLDVSPLPPIDLHAIDYVQWIESTVAKLRRQDYDHVDWQNLIEEIEEMGRSERKSLKSNFIVIVLHLLKWQSQPQMRGGSWAGSIVEHRRRIRDAIADSPSLKPYLHRHTNLGMAMQLDKRSPKLSLIQKPFQSPVPTPCLRF